MQQLRDIYIKENEAKIVVKANINEQINAKEKELYDELKYCSESTGNREYIGLIEVDVNLKALKEQIAK